MNSIEKMVAATDPGLDQESQNEVLKKLSGYAQIYEKLSKNTSLEDLLHIDIPFYRETYKDLDPYDFESTRKHYTLYGSEEGRIGSPYSTKEDLGSYITDNCKNQSILEINSDTQPILKGPNVRHSSEVPSTTDKVDVIISNSTVEYQPNLVKHLNEIYDLLNYDGRYCMVIPDHRYSFNANLPTSTIGDVLEAYYADRKELTIKNVIYHYCMATHNDTIEHWNFHNSYVRRLYSPTDAIKVMNALIKYPSADKDYLKEVRAWYFTPWAFSDIVNCLIKLDLVKFKRAMCNGTVDEHQEFTCILEK